MFRLHLKSYKKCYDKESSDFGTVRKGRALNDEFG